MGNIGVFYSGELKSRCGGPPTYLYNLREGLRQEHIDGYDFVGTVGNGGKSLLLLRVINKIWLIIRPYIKSKIWLQGYESIYLSLQKGVYLKNTRKMKRLVKEYQVLHFHSCDDLYYSTKYYKWNGKSILTMHAPEPEADEVIHELQRRLDTEYEFPLIYEYVSEVQMQACCIADAYLFPCEECQELYKKWYFYRNYCGDKIVKYVYTGTPENRCDRKKEKLRLKENVGSDKVVLLFCGRHNKIKGYDLLIEAFESISDYEQLQILAAGNTNPKIDYPKTEQWKELGWRNDMQDILAMSDIVVVPNRETYFDLLVLEAMAAGCIVLLSNTGGNLNINNLSKGVILFDSESVESLIEKIEYLLQLSAEERKLLGEDNLVAYRKYFSIGAFAKNYDKEVKEIETQWGL